MVKLLDPEEDWEALILDYGDAFKHITVDEAERKYMAGHALGGSFCYSGLLFGTRPGPLVWGRFVALIMRTTAAMNADAKSRLQCYVDDPVAILGGRKDARTKCMLRTILWWLALGLKL